LRFCLLALSRRVGQSPVSFRSAGLSIALAFALLGTSACGGGPAPEADSDRHVDGSAHVEGDDGHDEHGEELLVRLDGGALERLGLEILVAGPGELEVVTELPGEVQVNGDLMAHVGPRVGGVAREVLVSLGDTVRTGQLLAVLESRDLADAKAAFLAANIRLGLADATFKREERLWRDKISSEQDYLDALNKRAEARIQYRAAEQKLHALGFSQLEVEQLPEQHDVVLTEYRITAPFSGTVIAKHLTLGETVTAETSVFTVADLTSVWIDLAVYQKDIGRVRAGQVARVSTNHGDEAELIIDFVQPLVGEQTRTALARIIAPNPDGVWHPGCFVTARVAVGETESSGLVVPSTAVIRMEDGDEVVFVETKEGFEPRPVDVGRRTRDHVEVVSGLVAGDRYVGRGGFSLKAELGKSSFGDGHGH
jgi:cobalt-zinc-cadmium efflux system membrane fusion protein